MVWVWCVGVVIEVAEVRACVAMRGGYAGVLGVCMYVSACTELARVTPVPLPLPLHRVPALAPRAPVLPYPTTHYPSHTHPLPRPTHPTPPHPPAGDLPTAERRNGGGGCRAGGPPPD